MKTVIFFVLLAALVCFSGGCKEVNDNITVAESSQSIDRLPGISKPLR